MSDHVQRVRASHFLGPNGMPITVADLPPPRLKRWLPQHKAMVVAAVRHGLLTFNEACERYSLSAEEYLSWQRSFDRTSTAAATTARDRRD